MKSTPLFSMTRLRGMQVAYGHAISCALNFQVGKTVKFGGVIIAPSMLHIEDQSVPIARGGPSTQRE